MLTSDNQKRIWEHFQNEAPQAFDFGQPRLDFLVREISKRAGRTSPSVLNIGVGSGYAERQMLNRGWTTSTLDPDERASARVREWGVDARQGFIEAMPFESASFDFVVASEVLEHLDPDQRASGIAEIARVLKPGGWFLGTVPYREHLETNQARCPGCGLEFHRWGHLASFSRERMQAELAGHFRIEQLRRVAYRAMKGASATDRLKAFAKALLVRIDTTVGNPGLYFAARKP